MNRINLLPASYTQARRRARTVGLVTVGIVGLALTFSLWAGLAYMQLSRLDERIAALQTALAPVRQQRSEITQLQTEQARIAQVAAEYQRLALPLPASTVVGLLGERMPESVVLTTMTCAASPVQLGSTAVQGRAAAAPPPGPGPMRITLEGFGSSDIEVGRFARNLAACEAFEQVKMVHSREVRTGAVPIYEFRISFEVPADRPLVVVGRQEVDRAG